MRDELPDSVFPNNWISTHTVDIKNGGLVVTYPMKAASREAEKNDEIIKKMKKQYKNYFDVKG